MPRPPSNKRERLTQAAVRLVHTQGLERTTISDIAAAADVAPGSVYYYFKTKDDVARAVLAAHQERWDNLVEGWESLSDARARLLAYIDTAVSQADEVTAHGSAVAGLSADLRRADSNVDNSAGGILASMVNWAAKQFGVIGFAVSPARARALHLVTGMEGAAIMAHALAEPDALEREAAHLRRWVERTT